MQAPRILDYLGCKSGSDGMHFLWKHSLSVCCLSVSVDSLSLCVPFVLLVFICPSKDFHVTVYELKRKKIYWLNPKAQNQVPNTLFFSCSFAINLLGVICPHQERSRWGIWQAMGFDLGPVSCNVSTWVSFKPRASGPRSICDMSLQRQLSDSVADYSCRSLACELCWHGILTSQQIRRSIAWLCQLQRL